MLEEPSDRVIPRTFWSGGAQRRTTNPASGGIGYDRGHWMKLLGLMVLEVSLREHWGKRKG